MKKYLWIITLMTLSACQYNSTKNTPFNKNSTVNERTDLNKDSLKIKSDTNVFYSHFHLLAESADKLYIELDSIYYLMHSSPLKQFKNFKDIYDDYSIQPVEYVATAGTVLPLDNRYYCLWWLKNKTLYLSDVLFFSVSNDQINSVFPNKEHYKLMEQLTGVKFNKNITALPNIYNRSSIINNEGMMPALWFSDTLFVKESKENDESYEEWKEKSCKQLVFKSGKLREIKQY
jgi:hypothetical protein